MTKTKNALEMLKRRREKDPELRRLYEEERINFQIALLIRKEREAAGMTQKQLADLIDTTQSVISRLEDSDYEGHSLSIVARIAEALDRKLVLNFQNPEDLRLQEQFLCRHSKALIVDQVNPEIDLLDSVESFETNGISLPTMTNSHSYNNQTIH